MLIEAAYRAYSGQLLQAMIRFSRDEEAARDAVAQAFSKAWASHAQPIQTGSHAGSRYACLDLRRRPERAH